MKKSQERFIEILDTTLRDGEQTPGVAFTPEEKLVIAKGLLNQMHIDRLEIGSARVSEGEKAALKEILQWGKSRGFPERMEILGFVDGGKSVDWITGLGGKVINLLAKGSERHCRGQLKKEPRQHFADVKREIEYARKAGLKVNLYLEDWSNGMRNSLSYVLTFLKELEGSGIEHLMLPDTLGILAPDEVELYISWVSRISGELRLDFHAHNDYGMATANSLAAVKAGVNGIHTTINGLGERAGNLSLEQFVAALHDHTEKQTRVPEKMLKEASDTLQAISGKRCSWNSPIVGSDVFTQTCGVHADGDKKGNLYMNELLPERFGRTRDYALGKLSGKASIDRNADELGIEKLDPEVRSKVLQEVVRLGDKKKQLSSADLPFILAGVLHSPVKGRIEIMDYQVETRMGKSPRSQLSLKVDGVLYCEKAFGNGGYDAFMKALRKLLRKLKIQFPKLADYEVRIPPGGKTDAIVETTISWILPGGKILKTVGVDCDQIAAAVSATEKMLNIVIRQPDTGEKI